MRHFVIAATLGFAVLALSQGEVRANGGYGIGFGINFTWGCPKGPSCYDYQPPPPCWSPFYPCPTMYGGLYNYNPFPMYPGFGGYGYGAGLGAYDPSLGGLLRGATPAISPTTILSIQPTPVDSAVPKKTISPK